MVEKVVYNFRACSIYETKFAYNVRFDVIYCSLGRKYLKLSLIRLYLKFSSALFIQ